MHEQPVGRLEYLTAWHGPCDGLFPLLNPRLEGGGAVYDPVFDAEFPKEAYYGLFRAEDVILYTPKQACEQALKTRSAGPWTEVDDSRLKLLSSDRDRQGGFTRSGPSKSVKLTAI